MITAEQWVNQQFSKQIIGSDIYASKEGIIEAIVIFAQEAIKADRENVVNYVRTKKEWWEGPYDVIECTVVDKDSIINAPQIELL